MGFGQWTAGGTVTHQIATYNTLEFYWEQYNNVELNSSKIYFELRLKSGAQGKIEAPAECYLSVRTSGWGFTGEKFPPLPWPEAYTPSIAIGNNTQITLLSGTTSDIPHLLDGSQEVSFSIYMTIDKEGAAIEGADINGPLFEYGENCGFTVDCTLETIPKISTMTLSGSNIIGEEMKFNISKYNDSMLNTITYRFGSMSGTIATRTSENVVSWIIPRSLYSGLDPTETQKECTFTIETYQSDRKYVGEKSVTKVLKISNSDCKPKVDKAEFYDEKPESLALTGNNKYLIKNFNNIYYDVKVTPQNGATIESLQLLNDGKVIDETSSSTSATLKGNLYDIANGNFTIKATDSRGVSVETTAYLYTIDYSSLTCSIAETTFNEDTGTATVKLTGRFFNKYFGDALSSVRNNLVIEYRYRLNNENYSNTWTTLYNGSHTESSFYEKTIVLNNLNPNLAYYIQIRASDALTNISLDERGLTITPIFNWGKEDFQFNVLANCDKGLTITNQPVADFVVETGTAEMGTNGTWYWQKWNSGRAECYGCRNYGNAAVTTAWGVLYRSEVFNQNLPSGLFLNMPDVVDISFRNSNYGAWIAKHETAAPSETTTGSFILVRPASATLSQAKISFNVIGRWK